MSTKLIGIGAVVFVGLTAAAGGFAVLRDAAPVAQFIPAPSSQAPPPQVLPNTSVTQPAHEVTVPQVQADRPVVQRAAAPRPAPSTPAPVTPPEGSTQRDTPQPSSSVVPPSPPVATPAPHTAARYVPDLEHISTPPAPTALAEQPPAYEELTVARHSVIGIRLDYAVSTKTAQVEDRISASVIRDVTVNDRVAIPVGAKLEGTVTAVERGGKFRERPRLGLRFDTMILGDGTRLSISTDTIFREGDSPSADATAKVGGGAVAGAILGAVLGGKKGAVIGGAAGAAGGTAAVMRSDGEEASLRDGAPLTVRLSADLTLQIKR